jgi:hypothetical protein
MRCIGFFQRWCSRPLRPKRHHNQQYKAETDEYRHDLQKERSHTQLPSFPPGVQHAHKRAIALVSPGRVFLGRCYHIPCCLARGTKIKPDQRVSVTVINRVGHS